MEKFRNPDPFKKIGFSFRTRSEKAGNISLRVGHRFSFMRTHVKLSIFIVSICVISQFFNSSLVLDFRIFPVFDIHGPIPFIQVLEKKIIVHSLGLG